MKSTQKRNLIDIAVSIACYALTAFVFIYSASFRHSIDNSLAPAVWPRILCVLLSLCATIQLVNVLRGKIKASVVINNKKEVFLSAALIILYGICLEPVGYILCTVLLLFCLLKIFRIKKKLTLILTPLLTAVLSYYLFHSMLQVPLPAGLLKFILQ